MLARAFLAVAAALATAVPAPQDAFAGADSPGPSGPRRPVEHVVRVVEHASEAPVAGARVRAVDPLAGSPAVRRARASQGGFLGAFEDARVARTDAHGVVRITRTSDHLYVLVEHADRLAFLVLGGDERETEARLGPPHAVAARVVDAAGSPVAGVPVALGGIGFGGDAPLFRGDSLIQSSDAAGVARFAGYRPLTIGESESQRCFVTGEIVLALAVPGVEVRKGPIDGDRPPRGAIDLVLPPTGPVTVRAVDAAGRPIAEEGVATLAALTAGSSSPRYAQAQPSVLLAGGIARFPHAACAAELRASVAFGDLAVEWHAIHRAPRAPGEALVIDVVVERR